MLQKVIKAYQWCYRLKEHALRSLVRFLLRLPVMGPFLKAVGANGLCYFRMLAAIFIMWLFLTNQLRFALILFLLAVFADLIDGPFARETDTVSEEGKRLDPVSDKMLVSIPLLLIGTQLFNGLTIALYVFTEALLIFVAVFLKPYLKGTYGIPLASGSNFSGQVKMPLQSISVGLLMLNPHNPDIVLTSEIILCIAIGFGIGSFVRHLARMDGPIEPRKRIVTIPNLITFLGLFLCIPAMFAIFRMQYVLAFTLLVVIFLTDTIDGIIARRCNQRTSFGEVLDPIRDYTVRFLVLVWVIVVLDSRIYLLLGLCIMLIEVMVAAINISTARRFRTVSLVTQWGKNRTIAHFVLFGVLLPHAFQFVELPEAALYTIFGLLLLSSVIALLSYYGKRQHLIIAREHQTAGQR